MDTPQTKCKHFTGILNDTCAAGVNYMAVRDISFPFPNGPFPCLHAPITTCPTRQWMTAEEIAAEDAEAYAIAARVLKDLANDICPTCGEAVTHKEQVGRCVYGRPCGHRLYQGRLK